METTKSESALKLPSFSGKTEDFQLYWICFRAYAREKKFSAALKPALDDGTSGIANLSDNVDVVLDEANDTHKPQIEVLRVNAAAMAHFTMLFQSAKLMRIVYDQVMPPNGRMAVPTL